MESMSKSVGYIPVLILFVLVLPAALYSQCNVLQGQTVTVTSPETCGVMSIAGTLIIESTGSITGDYGSTLDGPGATIVINGGSFTINGRFNVGQGSDGYITINGGTFTVTDTWKYPDDPGGVHRMWINEGVVHSHDIELRGDRDAVIYIGAGVLRLDYVGTGGSGDYYDPSWWIAQGWLQPAEGYDDINIQDMGTYTEITAVQLSPRVQFETASSGDLETVTPAVFNVVLSQSLDQTVTVDYAVSGGTATGGGVDFTLLGSGTLTFTPGQTANTIMLDIVNDGLDEDDETVIVELSNPSSPVLLGSPYLHTYTIIDPRPTVQFASTASSGREELTDVGIPVELSQPIAETVTVDYAVTGGTATGGGVDYTLLGNGTLQFAPYDQTEYVNLSIVDDTVSESSETVTISLSSPTGDSVRLGSNSQHTYTIIDNDEGVYFDGLVWYYSDYPSPLTVENGALRWNPEKGEQIITRLPEQPLSSPGDYVEIKYWWLTDGAHSCPDCFACPDGCYDDDITCIAGTSDFRVGLFEADGEYITSDGFDVRSSVFEGYKGYGWRFGPNMRAEPTRWVDCTGEVHKTGNFQKKPADLNNLLTTNDGLKDYIPGFELPPGEWSIFTVSLERLSSSSVKCSITLNDRTYTWTDDSGSEQPSKIDVLAIHMRNGRPYNLWMIKPLCQPPAGDADGDCDVDWNDLKILADNWIGVCFDGPCCGDLNGDWLVNPWDFSILASDWLEVGR